MKYLESTLPRWISVSCLIVIAFITTSTYLIADNSENNLVCNPDFNIPNQVSDKLSNALTLGLEKDSTKVHEFLNNARSENLYTTGNELVEAAAKEFNIDEGLLFETVEKFKFINCKTSDIYKHYHNENTSNNHSESDNIPENNLEHNSSCNPNLNSTGQMSDIVSNALTLGLEKDSTNVRDFLNKARVDSLFKTGNELALAAAKEFDIDGNLFFETIEKYKYINCPTSDIYKSHHNESPTCKINLNNPGKMSDIVSNALMRGLDKEESKVRKFLDNAYEQGTYQTGTELAIAAANEFNVEEGLLFEQIEKYKYTNCPSASKNSVNTAKVKNTKSCEVDLTKTGKMSDIVSNALTRGLGVNEKNVRTYLEAAYKNETFKTGYELASSAAIEFDIDKQTLFEMINSYKYINCWNNSNSALGDSQMSEFSQHVVTHVVLHELGHALLREFGLPTLGNEETLADAFATHYLVTQLPDEALSVLKARIQSLMIEAQEKPRENWTVKGEHNSDARRAYQITALAIAFDQHKYASLAPLVDMSQSNINKATDYGSEVHSSWARILEPLWATKNNQENKVNVISKYSLFSKTLQTSHLEQLFYTIYQSFDWPQTVTLHFAGGEGSAGWSRSTRTVTLHDQYIARFNRQGNQLGFNY
ncbi:DUF4344 domain-containing metallopeptidase [Marinicellulosiphila megalodicopiae]|uniref:DUF4344 domain-containing metallopeptidase n=1 Tax=Marinicellulosiphila megalodicopiae TaxID=2724896 RepID=UPI003BB215F7